MAVEDYRADAMSCTSCAYCNGIPLDHVKSRRFAKGCPSIERNSIHSYSAGGRLVTMLSLMDGRSEVTEEVKKSVFECQLCGSCDVACKLYRYNMEPLKAMHELRFKLVEDGRGWPAHKPVIQGLTKLGNMLNKNKAERGYWAAGKKLKDLSKGETAEVLFFAGCRYSYDADLQKIPRLCVDILNRVGAEFGIMGGGEHCCGGRACHMGYKKEYQASVEHNIAAWEKAGVRIIVTPCADCYHTFKRLYPEAGASFEVIHMLEYLDRLIKEGQLKFTKDVDIAVTYHDPCHLGRQGEPYVAWNGKEKKTFGQALIYEPPKPKYNGAMGIYDPPRNILKAIPGVELIEMERIKEFAWCCGAGGGVKEGFPEYSDWTARERMEEAELTGAKAIVTACSWCERNFLDAAAKGESGLEVLDIIELVCRAL